MKNLVIAIVAIINVIAFTVTAEARPSGAPTNIGNIGISTITFNTGPSAPAAAPTPVVTPAAPAVDTDSAPVQRASRSRDCHEKNHAMVFNGKYAGNALNGDGSRIKMLACVLEKDFHKISGEVVKAMIDGNLYMGDRAKALFN